MQAVNDVLLPVLSALLVLLIPACVKLGVNALKKKMDEGREIARANAEELKRVTTEQAESLASALAEHRTELMTEVFAIKEQTTLTNGKVAETVKDISDLKTELKVERARTDLLIELQLKQQPDQGR